MLDDTRLPQRFWNKVSPEPNTGCWLWLGATTGRTGYGRTWDGQRLQLSHRYAYECLVATVPAGLELDHKCHTRLCCNPGHLRPVTHQVNMNNSSVGEVAGTRMRTKTACPSGHPYDEVNTYIRKSGGRDCRACNRVRNSK